MKLLNDGNYYEFTEEEILALKEQQEQESQERYSKYSKKKV